MEDATRFTRSSGEVYHVFHAREKLILESGEHFSGPATLIRGDHTAHYTKPVLDE